MVCLFVTVAAAVVVIVGVILKLTVVVRVVELFLPEMKQGGK